jgi:DNA-binding transcriptional MerR regulator
MASTTFYMRELAEQTGVLPRTLRHWIRKKLLPKPFGKGRAARYDAGHALRARVISQLRAQRRSLHAIRAMLEKSTDEQLQALLPPRRVAVTAEGIPIPPPPPSYPATAWEIVVLTDGLVLMVNTTKGPLLRRVAAEIYRHYSSPTDRSI